VDQATGDMEGVLVARGRKTPLSASFWKFGSRPSRMRRVAMPGSIPSSPSTTMRFAWACLKGFPTRISRHTKLIGQVSTVTRASAKVASRTSREPANANPAPGPM